MRLFSHGTPYKIPAHRFIFINFHLAKEKKANEINWKSRLLIA